MKILSPDEKGVFTVRAEDQGKPFYLLKTKMIIPDIEGNHCSSHVQMMNGCSDCEMAAMLNILLEEEGEDVTSFSKSLRRHIHPIEINTASPVVKVQLIRGQIATRLTVFFKDAGHKAAEAVVKVLKKIHKAEDDVPLAEAVEEALKAISWDSIVDEIQNQLAEVTSEGSTAGFSQVNFQQEENYTNKIAADYAHERAAELVGKRYVDGELVDNPNAKWAISNTTRDDIRDIIEDSFRKKSSIDEIAAAIKNSATFSAKRAELIARTEVSMAQIQGNLDAWRHSGIVKSANIQLSNSHTVLDTCDIAAEGGPYLLEDLPFVPIHPQCHCLIVAHELNEV